MLIAPHEFKEVQTLVRSLCGLVLTDDKTYLLRARLEAVVKAHGCAHFAEYLDRLRLRSEGLMRDELVEALTTGETSFNRDTHPFEEFRRQLLPTLAETLRQRRAACSIISLARIWSAGCSTGQEPYSLAMAIHEFIAANPALDLRPEHFPILATDVSAKSLSMAKAGRYPDRDVDRGLTKEQRNRHFRPHGEFWTASDDLRRWIEFRRLNFMDRVTTLGPFEVIFCRNVLIYFDTPSRQNLCDQFHQLLAPGGLLVLGAAESLYGLNTSFQSEPLGSTMVYRKTLP